MAALDFALIRQKDHIRGLITDEKYEEAIVLLNFTQELWSLESYAYKTAELRQMIRDSVRNKLMADIHWKQEEKWKKLLASVA